MASIILSFVGNQDPYSDKNTKEGSIVTLVEYLLEKKYQISRVILLHTSDTQDRAELTKDWLENTPLNLSGNSIDLIPVHEELSKDPINLLLAVREAKKGIELAKKYLTESNKLEFNASSGTPVMKSAWSILQAAGYAPKSSVWQVRNPHEMKEGQTRVFSSDVSVLKNEFDLQIIKKQLDDYNYVGALDTLRESPLLTDAIAALLEYGQARLAFDFNKAHSKIQRYQALFAKQLIQDIAELRQNKYEALLKEAYYKAEIKLKQNEYSDFLVLLISFLEILLRFLTYSKFIDNQSIKNIKNKYEKKNRQKREIENLLWQKIKVFDDGKLYQFLENYKNDKVSYLRLQGELSRIVTMAILEYNNNFSNLIPSIRFIADYAETRNYYVHELEGVSEIEEQDKLMKNWRTILSAIAPLPDTNPFDVLNQVIYTQLEAR